MTADDLTQRINAALDGTTPGPDDPTDLHYGDFGWYVTGCAAGETEDSEQGKRDALLFAAAPSLLRECRDALASLERHHEIVRNGAMDEAIESDAEIIRLRDALAEKDAEIERLGEALGRIDVILNAQDSDTRALVEIENIVAPMFDGAR